MISLVEPEICPRMLRNLTEKLRAKLLATAHVKFACLSDAFSEFIEGQSLQVHEHVKDKERRKRKALLLPPN